MMNMNRPNVSSNRILTPTRARQLSQASQLQATPSKTSKQNNGQSRVVSPNRLKATRKPIINSHNPFYESNSIPSSTYLQTDRVNINDSNFRSNRSNQCSNHPDRQSLFQIMIDDQVMLYCNKCGTHLASQGFKVQKLDSEKQRKTYPAYIQNHPRFKEITQFIQVAGDVNRSFRQNCNNFQQLDSHYLSQYKLLQDFYNAMIDEITFIKTQHINMLKAQSRKYIQIAQIQIGQNQQNIYSIESMSRDIQNNLAIVVSKLTEEQYRHNMNEYIQKIQLYKHRIEEQTLFFDQVINLKQDDLEAKLLQYRRLVSDLLGFKYQTNNNFSFQTKNQNKKGAFRNLFDVDDSLPTQSPSFKIR